MEKKLIVLCVDDEKVVLNSLKSQLRDYFKARCRFEMAEDSESALEILEELIEDSQEVAIAIVDYLMPGTKGDELMVKIHEQSPRTLCVMLTGQADLTAVANLVNNEALYRFLSKPWNKEDLLITLEEATVKYRMMEDLRLKKIELEKYNNSLKSLNQVLESRLKLFHKFVPVEFLQNLGIDINIDGAMLGKHQQKTVAVMFIDIRSFTSNTQKMQPKEIYEFVNVVAEQIAPIIHDHEGFIDKFIGDGTLAIFFDINKCLSSIFAIQNKLQKDFNSNRFLKDLRLGFSVNYGSVEMGVVGFENRMDTTIIGSPVNIAAKAEKLNKRVGTGIIVTEEVVQAADENSFIFNYIDEIPIEGIDTPLKFFSVKPMHAKLEHH